ncbi:MAG: hypothetical protein IH598_16495 [Bacteroidales bacterium]|nr:hypothetical protein [Bacteroidales bacterium]
MSESSQLTPNKNLIITINSTAYFMLAYIFVITVINFTSMVMAKVFYGLNGTLYHYGFDLDRKDFTWTLEPVVLIFFIGVLLALLFGVLFQVMYQNVRKGSGHGKLFLLWAYLIAYTLFFGDIVFGAFINYMPGAFFNYMNIPMVFRVIIGIFGLIMLFVIGQFSAKNILISLNIYLRRASMSQVEPFFYAQLIIPFVIGNILIFILKIPYQAKFEYIDTLVLLSLVIIVISVFFRMEKLQSIQFTRHRDSFRLKKIPILLAIIITLLFRFGLGMGLSL